MKIISKPRKEDSGKWREGRLAWELGVQEQHNGDFLEFSLCLTVPILGAEKVQSLEIPMGQAKKSASPASKEENLGLAKKGWRVPSSFRPQGE